MFSHNQRLFAPGGDAKETADSVAAALQQRGFAAFNHGAQIQIRGVASNGFSPSASLTFYPTNEGTIVDVSVAATLTQDGIILGVLMLIFFWPLVLLFGWLAYDAHQKRSRQLVDTTQWAIGQVGTPSPSPQPPPQPVAPPNSL